MHHGQLRPCPEQRQFCARLYGCEYNGSACAQSGRSYANYGDNEDRRDGGQLYCPLGDIIRRHVRTGTVPEQSIKVFGED